MNRADKCRRLADAIRSCFDEGISDDGRIQGYIDACLPGLSMEDAVRRICESPDLDTASLTDLIFFPEAALQARLEPLLEAETYGHKDEAVVAALLEEKSITTTLRDSEGRTCATLQAPPWVLAAFVRRLGISRNMPPALTAAIADFHPPEKAVRFKVMLRNAGISWTGPTVDFLKAFILGMDSGAGNFDNCVELMVELLGETGPDKDPFHVLRSKTDSLHRARNAARQFERLLQRSNMETLMHQGLRPPEIGAEEAERKILLLDRIGGAVALGGIRSRHRGKNGSPVDGHLEPENGPLLPG